MSCSKPSPYFFLPSFWYRLILISAIQRYAFFKCLLAKSHLALFVPMVNPLFLLWWSLILIVDFDIDTPTSWRVFFSWLDVVKCFFFTMERVLRSSTTVVLCGHPGLFYVAELTSAFFFFSQNVPNYWFGHECCCYLSDVFVLILKPKNHLFHLHAELLWLHDMGSQQQLPNANGKLGINSRPFTCLTDVDITKE